MKYGRKPIQSPSSRLRAVLFLLWEKRKIEKEFDVWYYEQIEKIIETVKKKLV